MNETTKEGLPNQRLLSTMLNPYGMKQEDMVRVQAFISPDDKYLLKSVYPTQGIESYLLAGIYKAVCDDLRARNITSYTPENARSLSQIIASHLAPVPVSREGREQNVTGGGHSVQPAPANSAEQPADVHQTTPGRRGDRGRLLRERAKEGKKAQGGPEQTAA